VNEAREREGGQEKSDVGWVSFLIKEKQKSYKQRLRGADSEHGDEWLHGFSELASAPL
jgi:hypothetical protein